MVVAADSLTVEQMAFMVRHGTGIVCVPMESGRLDELRLPLMSMENTEAHRTAFTIPVDSCQCQHRRIGRGDRVATIRALADPGAKAVDFRRPGHVFPLRYAEGGSVRRAGHTEASIDLLRMAGRSTGGRHLRTGERRRDHVPPRRARPAHRGARACRW